MNTQLLENSILENLSILKYPFTIEDNKIFVDSLNSPTQVRHDTIEWLFHQMEPELIDKIFGNKSNQITRLQMLFKFFGINETKDNITGMSTQENNMKCLYNLTNFALKYLKIQNNESFSTQETSKAYQLINYINKNKIEIFKEKIRLFVTEVGAQNPQKTEEVKMYLKNIQKNIDDTKQLIEKLDQKLSKIANLNISYEESGREDNLELKKHLIKFDKEVDIFLKSFNSVYEKEIKYISEDKLGKLHIDCELFMTNYNQLQNISDILEQIFAIHNNIVTFNF